MIDFKLNELGDIQIDKNETDYNKLRLSFLMSEKYPKLKISFIARDRMLQQNNGLKISFRINNEIARKSSSYVPCIRKEEELAQSLSIRLKTELNEIKHFFNNFGSELIKIRHNDLLNENNHEYIKQYVENAISDINTNNQYNISVKRVIKTEGNFAVENLSITIKDNGKKLYEYTI